MSIRGHLEKVGDPYKKGLSQQERLCRTDHRENDGPSHVSIGGHLEKTYSGMLEQTYEGLSWVRLGVSFCHSVTELGMPQSSPMTQMELLVLTYMCLT